MKQINQIKLRQNDKIKTNNKEFAQIMNLNNLKQKLKNYQNLFKETKTHLNEYLSQINDQFKQLNTKKNQYFEISQIQK